jgi:hypothetical protein
MFYSLALFAADCIRLLGYSSSTMMMMVMMREMIIQDDDDAATTKNTRLRYAYSVQTTPIAKPDPSRPSRSDPMR